MRGASLAAVAGLILLAGCSTKPLAPNPHVDLTGEWRVTAVNGISRTRGMSGFGFRYAPPFASASLGCNSASGPARVADGWLVTGYWIVTTARCSEERMRFSRGYDLFAEPLAIESPVPGRVRLRNRLGSIELARPR